MTMLGETATAMQLGRAVGLREQDPFYNSDYGQSLLRQTQRLVEPPTLARRIERMKNRKTAIEAELKEINSILKALDKNPEIEQIASVIQRLEKF